MHRIQLGGVRFTLGEEIPDGQGHGDRQCHHVTHRHVRPGRIHAIGLVLLGRVVTECDLLLVSQPLSVELTGAQVHHPLLDPAPDPVEVLGIGLSVGAVEDGHQVGRGADEVVPDVQQVGDLGPEDLTGAPQRCGVVVGPHDVREQLGQLFAGHGRGRGLLIVGVAGWSGRHVGTSLWERTMVARSPWASSRGPPRARPGRVGRRWWVSTYTGVLILRPRRRDRHAPRLVTRTTRPPYNTQKPTNAPMAETMFRPMRDIQWNVANSAATCRRCSAECTVRPSTNMISLRGQKYSIEITPSAMMASTLTSSHTRAPRTFALSRSEAVPRTQESSPSGGKKSLGPRTERNSIDRSSDWGGSL